MFERFERYKVEAAQRNPGYGFRSLEFRFSTKAPINWNEVEAIIDFEPQLSDPINTYGLKIDFGPTTRNSFDRGDYIVRSRPGSLTHVLELKDKVDGNFDGRKFLEIYGMYKQLKPDGHLVQVGSASFFTRSLQEGSTNLDPYSGEYNLGRGEYFMGTGWINNLTPTSKFGQ